MGSLIMHGWLQTGKGASPESHLVLVPSFFAQGAELEVWSLSFT